jgi:putative spermidine/putrescine transport system permease protein
VTARRQLPTGSAGFLSWAFAIVVLFFLLSPLIVVFPVSVTGGQIARFPPEGLSFRWYADFFSDPYWMTAVRLSFELGASVAVLSTLLGLVTGLAMTRFVPRSLVLLVRVVVLAPMIVPLIVSAIAIFLMMAHLHMVSTFLGLLIAHTILAVPYSVIVIENGFLHLDLTLEEAARTLGASRLTTFRWVTLPLILPSVVGSAVFAFITSFDEVVVVLLVGGASFQTLPVKMFVFLENEFRPTPAVVSSLLILGLVAAQLAARLLRFRQGWRRRQALRLDAKQASWRMSDQTS